MKKKVLSLLLTLCLAMTFVPMAAFAAEAPLFGGVTGTQQDPWLITSQADLIALAEFLNSGNAETLSLIHICAMPSFVVAPLRRRLAHWS